MMDACGQIVIDAKEQRIQRPRTRSPTQRRRAPARRQLRRLLRRAEAVLQRQEEVPRSKITSRSGVLGWCGRLREQTRRR